VIKPSNETIEHLCRILHNAAAAKSAAIRPDDVICGSWESALLTTKEITRAAVRAVHAEIVKLAK